MHDRSVRERVAWLCVASVLLAACSGGEGARVDLKEPRTTTHGDSASTSVDRGVALPEDSTPTTAQLGTVLPAAGVDESKPRMQADGPLGGLALASSLPGPGPGSEFDVRLTFTPADTEVVAVVGLSEDVAPGSIISITWYRLVGGQREAIFSHEFDVGPGGRAYSQAVARGGLAPGVYETVARLGERQARTPWVVIEPAVRGLRTRMRATPDRGVAENAQEPVAGDSGWDPPGDDDPWDTSTVAPPDTCVINSLSGTLIPITTMSIQAFLLGPCSRGTLRAAVSGPPVDIDTDLEIGSSFSSLYGQRDVCDLPGGSDMPGTAVRLEVTGSATGTDVYVYPTTAPPSPPSSSRFLPMGAGSVPAKRSASGRSPSCSVQHSASRSCRSTMGQG